MAKKKKAQAPPPPPQPQGKAQKRTPTSAFDPAAGNDVYEPEKIIGQRMAKGGITQYNVKWVGDGCYLVVIWVWVRPERGRAMVVIWLLSGCECVLSGEPDSVSCSGGAC